MKNKLIIDFKQYIKENNFKIWYRGFTNKTNENEYIWLTLSKDLAIQYSKINKIIYGGESIVKEFKFNDNDFNILDLTDYDMNDLLEKYQLEDFLDELDIEYGYEDLFDFSEDEIPLSRLVNKILEQIVKDNDGFKIFENEYETIYIKKQLLESI